MESDAEVEKLDAVDLCMVCCFLGVTLCLLDGSFSTLSGCWPLNMGGICMHGAVAHRCRNQSAVEGQHLGVSCCALLQLHCCESPDGAQMLDDLENTAGWNQMLKLRSWMLWICVWCVASLVSHCVYLMALSARSQDAGP